MSVFDTPLMRMGCNLACQGKSSAMYQLDQGPSVVGKNADKKGAGDVLPLMCLLGSQIRDKAVTRDKSRELWEWGFVPGTP